MSVALVTGSAGLVGSEAVRFFGDLGFKVVGIDNNMRRQFFGEEGSTQSTRLQLEIEVPGYQHHDVDIRDIESVEAVFAAHASELAVVVHAAAQPSHDWAATEPHTDFSVNADGTLVLLEATRKHSPGASFIYVSTNKVYGDRPNQLPMVELETRWEVSAEHACFAEGIDESMSVDYTMHSLFGASKLAADALTQEYGRYFGMNTVCFRCGCITGPGHAGTVQHGFLSYLTKCAVQDRPYTIIGYKGKQVRDVIHARDLVEMFWQYHLAPRAGEVYNAGGGRHNNCSVLELVALSEELNGRPMEVRYTDQNRMGDHIWYISDTSKFRQHYPEWKCDHDLRRIVKELIESA